jgi:hypothetical protein
MPLFSYMIALVLPGDRLGAITNNSYSFISDKLVLFSKYYAIDLFFINSSNAISFIYYFFVFAF